MFLENLKIINSDSYLFLKTRKVPNPQKVIRHSNLSTKRLVILRPEGDYIKFILMGVWTEYEIMEYATSILFTTSRGKRITQREF